MPCYDPYPRSDSSYDRNSERELSDIRNSARNAEEKANKLEAALCALLRELDASNNSHIIDDAEKNGKVDIKTFKKEHFSKDDKRINDLLSKLSEHEKQMLKDKLK